MTNKVVVTKEDKDMEAVQWFRVTDSTPGKYYSVSVGVTPQGQMIYSTGKLCLRDTPEACALHAALASGTLTGCEA